MERSNTTRLLTLSAMMVAILIILGLFPGIPLGFIPVPIVLQNMGVMMSGELLGPRYGTISVGLFLLLAFLGMPILSGGNGGMAVFIGPTGGYLIAWLFTPLLIGLLINRFQIYNKSWIFELLILLLAGVIFIDLVGAIWLSYQSHITLIAALISNLAFIPGDLIKSALAVIIVRRIRKAMYLSLL